MWVRAEGGGGDTYQWRWYLSVLWNNNCLSTECLIEIFLCKVWVLSTGPDIAVYKNTMGVNYCYGCSRRRYAARASAWMDFYYCYGQQFNRSMQSFWISCAMNS